MEVTSSNGETQAHFLRNPVRILYEDDHYVVFDKPSGLLVIPTPKNERNTLVNIVNSQHDLCPRTSDGTGRLHPCHRLDRDTSGVILFAKGKHHQKLMMEVFKKRSVFKKYIALVHGRLDARQGELRSCIEHLEQKKFRRRSTAKLSITRYKVIQEKKQFSIVEVQPVTGRTNQIRIQFSDIGHPLVGERKYALGRDYALKFRRVALHAQTLEWTHPVSRQKIKVTSQLPKDMEDFIARN